MLVSRPNKNTLFALSFFLLLNYALLAYLLTTYGFTGFAVWYVDLFTILLIIIGAIVTMKVISGNKVILIDKEKIQVKYPMKFSKKRFRLKQLELWEETIIKTSNSVFKELHLRFENGSVKLSKQENSNYEKVLSYFKRNAAKKQKRPKN
ncbi:hypothetical protein QQ008_27000 [Fulvivirgaceae bacterium BMA10]|uniref:PH domain-containing protein n=1 Tax=Splendidivirga corallicola TaxID=3051826 RepID=A0ABT8KYQ6_9BACT|nr:hypothetical protein [Fulvivirgaceae bacterium BMA10]